MNKSAASYSATQKNNQLKHEQKYLQRRQTNDKQAHEKMLNIISHRGNANQNHSEKSLHTHYGGHKKKKF